MQDESQIACESTPSPGGAQACKAEDLIYQAITVIAALVLLGSLWVF
jgi:hypothetical protein